jgi:dTMP kinase
MKDKIIKCYVTDESEYNRYGLYDLYTTDRFEGIVINKRWFNGSGELSVLKEINKGRLIEFEGIDASGKTTYIEILREYLEKEKNIKVKIYSFPQYETYIGSLIAKYLRGEYGDINSIPKEILNIVFASDRVSIQKELKRYIDEGYYVILNRYTYSNLFQIARDKKGSVAELEELEFESLNLKKPDDIIYLTLPIETVIKRINNRKKRTYQNDKDDIFEQNKQLLIDTDNLYRKTAEERDWFIIEEFEDGDELPIGMVFEKIKLALKI